MWPQFGGLKSRPLLVVRGENSDLLSKEVLQRMAEEHPDLSHVEVLGQGHAPLLHTAGLPNRILAFLETAHSSTLRSNGIT
jgi:pimeloyl-ACP methyl ester carboxylesterase